MRSKHSQEYVQGLRDRIEELEKENENYAGHLDIAAEHFQELLGENETLHTRVEELDSAITTWKAQESIWKEIRRNLRNRIDELESATATWEAEEAAWKEIEAGLLARVEELDKEKVAPRGYLRQETALAKEVERHDCDQWRAEGSACAICGNHPTDAYGGVVITRKQIAAAVEYAETWQNSGHAQWIWSAFGMMGINRCGGCDACDPPPPLKARVDPLATCNGDGYTVEGK